MARSDWSWHHLCRPVPHCGIDMRQLPRVLLGVVCLVPFIRDGPCSMLKPLVELGVIVMWFQRHAVAVVVLEDL